jgi:Carboxypeptidase regulatory-like domain
VRALSALLMGVAAALTATRTSAQQSGATLRGVVVDSLENPVRQAHVTLNPGAVGATTDSAGVFAFTGVRPGSYRLTVR